MIFTSFEFAIFLVLCLTPYYALQWAGYFRLQNGLLLIASYLFYAAWDWRFLSLIAVSTIADYAIGLALARFDHARTRRLLVGASLVINLGILGFFKYADFFAEGLVELLASIGLPLAQQSVGFTLDVVLPVGISFYTFQTLSYTIDIYRRSLSPTRNFLDFALFVAFFPQLVAGPIERAAKLLPQIQQQRHLSWHQWSEGGWLIFWGIFKKVVIADNLAKLVDLVYSTSSTPSGGELWIATYAFAIQIYCDFSGYTDIARGVMKMMGFELALNFRLPYFAANPNEFWQRWHISLSTWLRDYLYVSLGGGARGRARAIFSVFTTMLLGGLWHGAASPFLLWGGYHGVLLGLHRACANPLSRINPTSFVGRNFWLAVRIFATFHLIALGLVIFRSADLAHVASNIALLSGTIEFGSTTAWMMPLAILITPLLVVQIAQARSGDLDVMLRWPLIVRTAFYLLLGFMIVVMGEDGGRPFISFQF